MSKNLLAFYIRVSQEDENEGESNSIINQRNLLETFVKDHPELSQYKTTEFCDDGYSGTNFDRPGVKALLEQVKAGKIHCIIVKDLSRFGRNYIDIGDYLEQIFPFLGVRFISINDHFDSSNFDGTTGGLDVGFKNLIYSLYSKDLSQKIRSAIKTRMEKGEFIGNLAPYGYAKSPENSKKLVIDEKAAAIVRRIFEMADEGKNAVQIAVILNSEKIPTPSAYKRLMGCDRKYNVIGNTNFWQNTTILTIIRDERYTGKMVNGKSRNPNVGSKHGKRVPKSEWIVVPNTHEAIISEDLFDSVQNRFYTAAKQKDEKPISRPLLGKVKCGICRHCMIRSNSTPSKAYYYCGSHRYITECNCTKDRIFESELIHNVLSAIHSQMAIMLDMEQILERVQRQSHSSITAMAEQIKQHQALLTKLRASKIKTYEKYKDGILDKESYTSLKSNVSKEIEGTEAQIAELETAVENSYQNQGQPCSVIENFKKYQGFKELTKEMTDELIDIYVYGSEKIEIVWNYMDEGMAFLENINKEREEKQ